MQVLFASPDKAVSGTPDKVAEGTADKMAEGTGGAPDELEQLRAELARVKARNAELEEALKGVLSGGSDVPIPEESEEDGELSKEAARKKLWRICKKDAQG